MKKMSSFPASSVAKTQAEDLSSTEQAHPTPISEPDTSDEMNQSSTVKRGQQPCKKVLPSRRGRNQWTMQQI